MNLSDKEFDAIINSNQIYGDNFSEQEIKNWFDHEKNASYELYEEVNTSEYDIQNEVHVYSKIRDKQFSKCLALGAADGGDIAPLAPQIDEFIIIEPEERFWNKSIGDTKTNYISPNMNGDINIPSESIDLSVSIGCLHHIPNVSHVIMELSRTLKKGGTYILREPIVSMGDWRKPRRGLTAFERGLPNEALLESIKNAGLKPYLVRYYDCPIIPFIARKIGLKECYSYYPIVMLDIMLCSLFKWNIRYHQDKWYHKFAPSSVYILAEKI